MGSVAPARWSPTASRSASPLRIVKLGGSLLLLPDLARRFESWLDAENAKREMTTLLVVGGGKIIDTVRELASVHAFDDAMIHHECIRLLSHTARMVQLLVSGCQRLGTPGELQNYLASTRPAKCAIVDIAGVYSLIEKRANLSESWATTTDTLAAGLAIATEAEQLCLLKSAEPPIPLDERESVVGGRAKWFRQLADAGYVDPAFPEIANQVSTTRFVNFRAPRL